MTNIFISYCHADEAKYKSMSTLKKHLKPLVDKENLRIWDDTQKTLTNKFDTEIQQELNNANIVICMISADYLASVPCCDEMNKVLCSSEQKIFLALISPCDWKSANLSSYPIVPTDAKPITDFSNQDQAYNDICNHFKTLLYNIKKNIDLTATPITSSQKKDFLDIFYENKTMDLIFHNDETNEKVEFEDYFFPLNLQNDSSDTYSNISFDKFLENVDNDDIQNIAIYGDEASGRTTILKYLYKHLNEKYLPIYLCGETCSNKMVNKILEFEVKNQYEVSDCLNIKKFTILILFDDFHLLSQKRQEEFILYTKKNNYRLIITCENFFELEILRGEGLSHFTRFHVPQMGHNAVESIVRKWIDITNKKDSVNESKIDNLINRVNAVLKFGIPKYPYYLYTILSSIEKRLDSKITSQGYCYQTLIYIQLINSGVENVLIDSYYNFLTQLAFFYYDRKEQALSEETVKEFLHSYSKEYQVTNEDKFYQKIINANILKCNATQNVSFASPYMYYFFLGKYLAENKEICKVELNNILGHFEYLANSYTIIFLIHHSKDTDIIESIQILLMCMYDKHSPAIISKIETETMKTFRSKILINIGAINSYENRKTRNNSRDILEAEKREILEKEHDDDNIRELKKAINTIEVMSYILQNRFGSLKKKDTSDYFETSFALMQRITTMLTGLIKEIETFICNIVSKKSESDKYDINAYEDLIRKECYIFYKKIFLSTIFRGVHLIGNIDLFDCLKDCLKEHDEIIFKLLLFTSNMEYKKNINIKELREFMKSKDVPDFAKNLLSYILIRHMYFHKMSIREYQQIIDITNLDPHTQISLDKTMISVFRGNCSH